MSGIEEFGEWIIHTEGPSTTAIMHSHQGIEEQSFFSVNSRYECRICGEAAPKVLRFRQKCIQIGL